MHFLGRKTGVQWCSKVPMTMHACGHDGHVGTLLAAVHYINQHRDFARRLVAIFQRGEEGFAGGRYMIEDGLVQKFGIDEFYALHAEPLLPVGFVELFRVLLRQMRIFSKLHLQGSVVTVLVLT